MIYKELKCERPYQRATIELNAKELWLLMSMVHTLENDERYKDNEEFKNLRKEFFLLYNIVNDGFIGEQCLEIVAEMVEKTKELQEKNK